MPAAVCLMVLVERVSGFAGMIPVSVKSCFPCLSKMFGEVAASPSLMVMVPFPWMVGRNNKTTHDKSSIPKVFSRGLSVLQSFTTLGNPGKKKIRMKKWLAARVVADANCEGRDKGKLMMMEILLPEVGMRVEGAKSFDSSSRPLL